MPDIDLKPVDDIVARLGRQRRLVIPILQAIQEHYHYLPPAALERVCQVSEIPPALVAGVSTFYTQFRHKPAGRHIISICHGTACHVKGADGIHDALTRALKLTGQQDTDEKGVFTVQKVACLGCCTLAPVMQIDQVTYGHLTPDKVAGALRDFLELRKRRAGARLRRAGRIDPKRGEIRVGLGSCCQARGSAKVQEALHQALDRAGLDLPVKRVGCVGMCHQTPLVEIVLPGQAPHLYARVESQDVGAIVLRHLKPRGAARRLGSVVSRGLERLLTDESWSSVERYTLDVRDDPVAEFLGPQRHLATEHCGQLDPTDLDEYLARGGFEALKRALATPPEQIIDQVARSGLRGRGGAGFPTGRKWAAVRAARGQPKYLVCNGDEGDPGAFMDRMILESYPYRVIEGMAVAAWAVGAAEGIFYIRAEYPLAVWRVREALEHCRKRGLLGENALGAGRALKLEIMEGAGAFVCGEETALLASLEGRRGMPRLRPPFPADSGLWGKPTLVNNVETYALVPWIIRHGPEAFAALGTADSKGTKVFALAGKVARGGLVEVPMGVTLRQIVNDIGGGCGSDGGTGVSPVAERGMGVSPMPARGGSPLNACGGSPDPPRPGPVARPDAAARESRRAEDKGTGETPVLRRSFKAVQIGGPSGGCLPESLADTPVDYEALVSAGAIMGSGGLVVMDDSDCLVDIARYFLQFTQDQSCGKCTFCRVGTRRMLDIMDRIVAGQAHPADLEELEELARLVKRGSLCGLGRTAPNPILTTLRYFRAEYEAHLQKRCPAKRCRALIRYTITDDCIGCTLCAQHCPADAIPMRPYEKHEIDQEKCTKCDTCRRVCPAKAVSVE